MVAIVATHGSLTAVCCQRFQRFHFPTTPEPKFYDDPTERCPEVLRIKVELMRIDVHTHIRVLTAYVQGVLTEELYHRELEQVWRR